jgi:hypothetical protein
MSDTITIGKRLVPIEQIALVEPFDPASYPGMQSERTFKSRVVLIDRESVLAEAEPFDFGEKHAFRMLLEDNVAANPAIRFGVQTFEPSEGFNPTKPYRSRLIWRDADNIQSKLLLTAPEILLAIAVRGEPGRAEGAAPAAQRRQVTEPFVTRETVYSRARFHAR